MGIKLLFNTIGEAATTITSSLAIRSECELYDIIGGHRSRHVETSETSTEWNLDFTLASTKTLTHLVVSNINHFTTSLDANELEVLYGASFSTSSLAVSLASLNNSLYGIKSQDTVIAHERSSDKFRISFKNVSDSSIFRVGKVYLCEAFNFNGETPILPSNESYLPLSDENKMPAVRGQEVYKCEKTINLTYTGLTYSDIKEFESKPLHNPFFIFDENADLIGSSLEHVICEAYTETREAHNTYILNLILHRLKHYE